MSTAKTAAPLVMQLPGLVTGYETVKMRQGRGARCLNQVQAICLSKSTSHCIVSGVHKAAECTGARQRRDETGGQKREFPSDTAVYWTQARRFQ